MNEFEDLLNSVSQVEPGDVVSAEVLTVDATQANVAISGTGVEGVLTLRELTNDRDADINSEDVHYKQGYCASTLFSTFISH